MTHWDLQFSSHSSSTFYQLLFPKGYHDDHNPRGTSVYHIYDVDVALDVLRTAVLRFYSLPRNSVDLYRIVGPAKMHLTLWKNAPELTQQGTLEWHLEQLPRRTFELTVQEPLGPFSNGTQALFLRLVEMDVELHVISIAQEGDDFKAFEWEVHLLWNFVHRGGRIDMYLVAAASPVHSGRLTEHVAPAHGGDFGTWLGLILGALCGSSLALRLGLCRQIRGSRNLVKFLGVDVEEASPTSGRPNKCNAEDAILDGGAQDVPVYLQWRVHYNVRDIAILVFLLLGAAQGRHMEAPWGKVGVFHNIHRPGRGQEWERPVGLQELLIWLEVRQGIHAQRLAGAVGVFWAWLCVCESPSPSLLSRLLVQAIPPVVSFFFTTLPLYVGFASLGVVLFAEHSPRKFGTLGAASVTLFSLLNGDVLMETMLEVEAAGVALSRAYVCTFICVFVFTVLNAVLCLIQDSFRLVKARKFAVEE